MSASTAPASIVLYVEDEVLNRELMRGIFKFRPELRLMEARLGVDALEMAKSECPDLILLDRNLPDMNGEEVLRTLRSRPETQYTPVIIISGDTARPQPGEEALGVLYYVIKPYDIVTLLAQIDSALRTQGEPPPMSG